MQKRLVASVNKPEKFAIEIQWRIGRKLNSLQKLQAIAIEVALYFYKLYRRVNYSHSTAADIFVNY